MLIWFKSVGSELVWVVTSYLKWVELHMIVMKLYSSTILRSLMISNEAQYRAIKSNFNQEL